VNNGTVVGTAAGGGQATDSDPAYYTAAVATYSTNSSTAFLASNYDNLTYTGAGNFAGSGNAKDNVITGGIGNDTLDGVTGADTLIGGLGNDTYIVDNAGDKVIENPGEGTDTVKTSLASYTLPANVENLIYTGSGNFAGTGNGGDNSITGGPGNDTLDGGAGNDTMAGGLGNDTYIVGSASDVVTEAPGAGTDTVLTTLANYTLGSNIENLTFTGVGTFTGTGNTLANVITGGAGNDTLDGGAGADTMTGGTGNDTYVVDNAGDVVNENPGEGIDTVKTTLSSYTLPANVENLIYTGASAFAGTGNSLNNVLTGGPGADTLTGGAGADTLTGGAGADHFVFSSADFGTTDEITDFSHAAGDKIDLSAIDANTTINKDQAFTFIGTGAFTHVAAQLHYTISGGAMLLSGDVNGDGVADFTIKVDGVGGLVNGDFIL
jgi:Ca2+-binding RTX toxin-like protein